jgi:hypothetical protein
MAFGRQRHSLTSASALCYRLRRMAFNLNSTIAKIRKEEAKLIRAQKDIEKSSRAFGRSFLRLAERRQLRRNAAKRCRRKDAARSQPLKKSALG